MAGPLGFSDEPEVADVIDEGLPGSFQQIDPAAQTLSRWGAAGRSDKLWSRARPQPKVPEVPSALVELTVW